MPSDSSLQLVSFGPNSNSSEKSEDMIETPKEGKCKDKKGFSGTHPALLSCKEPTVARTSQKEVMSLREFLNENKDAFDLLDSFKAKPKQEQVTLFQELVGHIEKNSNAYEDTWNDFKNNFISRSFVISKIWEDFLSRRTPPNPKPQLHLHLPCKSSVNEKNSDEKPKSKQETDSSSKFSTPQFNLAESLKEDKIEEHTNPEKRQLFIVRTLRASPPAGTDTSPNPKVEAQNDQKPKKHFPRLQNFLLKGILLNSLSPELQGTLFYLIENNKEKLVPIEHFLPEELDVTSIDSLALEKIRKEIQEVFNETLKEKIGEKCLVRFLEDLEKCKAKKNKLSKLALYMEQFQATGNFEALSFFLMVKYQQKPKDENYRKQTKVGEMNKHPFRFRTLSQRSSETLDSSRSIKTNSSESGQGASSQKAIVHSPPKLSLFASENVIKKLKNNLLDISVNSVSHLAKWRK